jgi:SNF2 domain-containing protein
LAHPGFALLPEQRVGKCLIALSVADARKPDVLVIVCPKKAIRVWREQMREHIRFDWKCQKAIVHYEAMCRSPKDRRWWRKRFRETWADQTVMIVVDEGHRIKGRGSMQSQMLRSVGKVSEFRLLLTGTPVDKVFEDSWAIMDFVEPGALGDTWDEFADEYLKFDTKKNEKQQRFYKVITGYRNTKRLSRIIGEYSYRVTLKEAQKLSGLRPYLVKRRVVRFDLKADTRRVYNELETELETEVNRKKVSTPLVVTLVSKLQQLTGGFLIHKEQIFDRGGLPVLTPRGKPKFFKSIIPVGREKLLELVKVVKRFPKGKRFVVCVQYTHEVDIIGRQLERLGRSWKRLDGQEYFDGTFETDAIVMQVKSGEAVDLAKAQTFIMYSWNHSNIAHEQAKFRVLSFKSKVVEYIYLMANESVDEQIYQAVRRKKNLTRLVIDRYRRRRRKREVIKGTRSHKGRAQKAVA